MKQVAVIILTSLFAISCVETTTKQENLRSEKSEVIDLSQSSSQVDCLHKAAVPRIKSDDNWGTVVQGQTLTQTIQVSSVNHESCNALNVTLQPYSTPQNTSMHFSETQFDLSPGEVKSIVVSIQASDQISVGQQFGAVKIELTGHPTYWNGVKFSFNVSQAQGPLAPILSSATHSNGNYILNFSQPGSISPAGGFDTYINNIDQNDNASHSGFTRTIAGLDNQIEQCFKLEARHTQLNPSQFPQSNEICVEAQTPTCVRANPSLVLNQSSFTGNSGDSFNFNLTLTNNDQNCADNTFALGLQNLPSGFTSNLPSTSTLAAGASTSFPVSISTSESVTEGNYTSSLSASNGQYSASKNLNFAIQEETAQELKAFPTAYGAGAYATGGRGGSVYRVTNLNNSGSGSFRDAVSQSNRTIIFGVSGTIELTSPLAITADNLTIAGQTAPAGGITITGKDMSFSHADNLILRYFRVRPDFITQTGGASERDALSFWSCDNVIIDHVSASWGSDEALSVVGPTTNITMQRTLLAESKTGSLFGSTDNTNPDEKMSVHDTMYYNISHRFPNPSGYGRFDFINILVHNWQKRLHSQYGPVQLNQFNNYYQLGCQNPNVFEAVEVNRARYNSSYQPSIYSAGNLLMPGVVTDVNVSNLAQWQWWFGPPGTSTGDTMDASYLRSTQFPLLGAPLPVKPTSQVLSNVTADVGANKRIDANGNVIAEIDSLDQMYIYNTVNNICSPYLYYGTGYGTAPNYYTMSHYINFHASVSNTSQGTGYTDTDGDGMPNAWESANGFNPNVADGNGDADGDGYTNLEEFLNLVDY